MLAIPKVYAAARFPATPASVPAARKLAGEWLRDGGLDELADRVELAVSELATNAIFYGGSDDFVVSIDAVSLLEISVEDGSTAIPVQRSPQIDSPRGRGLAIVDSVSDGWGFELTDGGKRVWCRFALDHADAGPAPGFEDAGLTSAPGG